MSTPPTLDPAVHHPHDLELQVNPVHRDGSSSQGPAAIVSTPRGHAGVLGTLPKDPASGKRLDYRTPVTEHVQQGKGDTLHVLGRRQSALPQAPTSALTRLAEALDPRKLFSLVATAAGKVAAANPTHVDAALGAVQQSVMQAISEQAGHADAAPTHLMAHMDTANPVARIWTDQAVPASVRRPSAALQAALDGLHQGQHKAPAVALSFAFQGAEVPGKNATTEVAALNVLGAPDLMERMSQAVRNSPIAQQGPAAQIALATLCRAAHSNQFPEMLALLGHSDLDEKKVQVFKTMLQAHEASQRTAPGTEADEAGNEHVAFAQRVALASATRLEAPERLSIADKTDIFVWHNKLGEHRDTVKARLTTLAEFYGYEDNEISSPLRAARLGLGGADLRTLKEEGAAVLAMADHPCMTALIGTLREETATRLAEATTTEEKAGLIAQMVALDNWTPERRSSNDFSLHDLASGRGYDMSKPDTVERNDVEQYCRYALANQPVPTHGNLSGAPQVADQGQFETLRDGVHKHLGGLRMNMGALAVLADSYNVDDEMLQREHGSATVADLTTLLSKAGRAINGESAVAGSHRPEDAIALISDFFSDAQFGNNVRYAVGGGVGLTSRGFAYNFAPFVYDDAEEAAHRAVLARVNVGAERYAADVVRFGVATHGAEWSFGQELRYSGNGGVGAQYGRTWGPEDHPSEFRIAGGLDVPNYTYEHTAFEGIMVRSMRLVDKDSVALDANPPTFAHHDKAVRDEMAALQPKIRARARELIVERDAARDEGRAFDVDIGEQMLQCFAEDGMESGLSMGLIHQETNVNRVDAAALAGVSLTTPGETGVRSGIGGSTSLDFVLKQTFEQTDTTGLIQVVNHRQGSSVRLRTGASESENVFIGSSGLPTTDLAGATTLHGEAGAQAKVRFVLHEDKLVPRFCFSDAEFPDVEGYKKYLNAHEGSYADMFSYKHDGDLDAGRKDLADYIELVEEVRKQNHINYARARTMEQVTKQVDEYRGIQQLVPAQMGGLKAELEASQLAMMGDQDTFQKVSGITYAVQTFQRGPGQMLSGLRLKASTDMNAEREIFFETAGWGWLAVRERDIAARLRNILGLLRV